MKRRRLTRRVKKSKRINRKTSRKLKGGNQRASVILKTMLETCLQACEALQPFVQKVYEIINYEENLKGEKLLDENKEKEIKEAEIEAEIKQSSSAIVNTKLNNNDVFTIADGIVQYILRKYLFKGYLNFVGEEDVDVTEPNDDNGHFVLNQGRLTTFDIPTIFTPIIQDAITTINALQIPEGTLNQFTIFVDPIDGTAEFKGVQTKGDKPPPGGKGEQATIMIGFADINTYKPVAGIIYRPVINPAKPVQGKTYAYGWIDENGVGHVVENLIKEEPVEGQIRFITSNGSVSKDTLILINILNPLTIIEDKYELDSINVNKARIKSGGAGNKILMLLENKADVYLQDRGLSRWDTCAGSAILKANGGSFGKLSKFLDNGLIDSDYTYKKVDEKDMNPNNRTDPNYTVDYNLDHEGKERAKHIEQNSILIDPVDIKNVKKLENDILNLREDKDYTKKKEEINKQIKTYIKDIIEKEQKRDKETNPIPYCQYNATNNLCGLFAIKDKNNPIIKQISHAINPEELKFSFD